MNCTQAKQISLLQILYKLGHKEVFTRTNRGTTYYWFISPFRPSEAKPSFSLNSELNTFYDYGNGISGTVIDYICAYYYCEIPKALELLDSFDFSFSQQSLSNIISAEKEKNDHCRYDIVSIRPVTHRALLQYLDARKLNPLFYKRYLLQIDYTLNDSYRFAVAFENNSHGYELSYRYWNRSEQKYVRMKQCLIKKDITHIKNARSSVIVTESWSDFLALLTLYPKMELRNDFIIMNSVAMLDRMISRIDEMQYQTIYSATDNDAAGSTVLHKLIAHYDERIIALNPFYQASKDIADFLERGALK